MKLHLPNGLRKALLACLAALALPVTSLPATVATASGIAAAWIGASQWTMAEDVTITKKTDNETPEGSYDDALQNKNAAGNKWIFDLPSSGTFYFGVSDNPEPTHLADFELRQTLTVNQGFNNSAATFKGAFTGAAGANLVFRGWNNNAAITNTWQFDGDLSQFNGNIESAFAILNVVFGTGAQTNAGAIKRTGGTLNLTLNGQTVHNSEINVSNLFVNGAVNLGANPVTVANAFTFASDASVTLGAGAEVTVGGVTLDSGVNATLMGEGADATLAAGTFTSASGASLTLGAGVNVTLNQVAANSSALTNLSLEEGAVLTVKRGVLKGQNLEMTGTATIKVGSYEEGGDAIDRDAVSLDFLDLTGSGRLVIDITGLGLKPGYSFQLFTGVRSNWTDRRDRLSFVGGVLGDSVDGDENWEIVVGVEGEITLKSTRSAFSYGGTGDLAWGVSGDGGWDDGQVWDNSGRDVNFTATEGTHRVSLTGATEPATLNVGVMDVAAGTAVYDIAGQGVELSVGSLTVGDGATMNFKGGAKLSIGSYLWMGENAVLAISEDLEFALGKPTLVGKDGSKIVRAAGVTDPVYLGLRLGGETNATRVETNRMIGEYFTEEVLGHITLEDVGIRKRGKGTLAFVHDSSAAEDTFDVALDIAEGVVQFVGNTFTINKQVTGAGKLQIATKSDDEEVMVHLVGGTDMDGTLELSRLGARLGLGADSIVGGLNTCDTGDEKFSRVIIGEKDGGNVKLTIDGANGTSSSLIHVEISGVDIVKRGGGTQQLSMKFSGGSITVEAGTLFTTGGQHWSALDATSVSISKGATFHWEDAVSGSRGYVSGEVNIQGTFKVGDAIDLAQGATIGESGNITTHWQAHVGLGADLIVSHSEGAFVRESQGLGTLEKAEGAAEHVHLQLGGNNQEYLISNGKWDGSDNTIIVGSSLGLYWRGNGGQLKVENSSFDEVLVGGSGTLWFQGAVTLEGELKTAEGYAGEANVYVHNNFDTTKLTLKAGGTLKSVLNGGWGTFIDLGADFEVRGLQWKDVNGEAVGDGDFGFTRYTGASENTVSLVLNVIENVTLENGLTLGKGVRLEKKGAGTQTVTGAMEAEGDVAVTEGTLELRGGGSEIGGALSGAGTLKVGGGLILKGGGNFAGTLEMEDAAVVTVGDSTKGTDLSVGTLKGTGGVEVVSGGTLTVGTAEGATLSGLALRGGSNLTVQAGSFTISGSWTWGKKSVLRLETAGQTITLGDGISVNPPRDETGAFTEDGQLTVDLTEAFMGSDGAEAGQVQLFESGFNKEWADYFRFTVDGQEVGGEGNYEGLKLNSKGVLRWGFESLYWGGDGAADLTWNTKDTAPGAKPFDLEPDGTGEVAWADDSDVYFVAKEGTHTVTLVSPIVTGNFSVEGNDERTISYVFTAASEQTLTVGGDLEVGSDEGTTPTGANLTFRKGVQLVVGEDVKLNGGSKLTINSDMVFGGRLIGGRGSVAKGTEASGTVYALWGNGDSESISWDAFEGKYGDVRGDGVGYGVSMSEKDLTIVGPADPEGDFKVAGAGKTLTFEGGITGSGSITGDGMLKVTEGDTGAPPVFTGHIEVANFIVGSGAQTLGGGATVSGTITLTGGVLNLGATASDTLTLGAAVVLAPEAEGAADALLHVVGKAVISTLSGTGKVTVDNGVTLTLSGPAEGDFTGQIDGQAEVSGTGVWHLGGGAQLSNLTVNGTVSVQEGVATVQKELKGSGTIAGEGTLRLTAGSGTFGGTVSSRFAYAGGSGGTFELSGAINSPDVCVESGTLVVSGAGTVPGVTLAGGTLDAAKDGLTVTSLTLEGEASGLKVTSNLTVGEVKGDGALGSLNIGAGAGLTVQSGNLTLNGQLSWGSGATLTLGRDYQQKFVWGPKFGFGLEGGHLKVRLWERYLRGLKKDVDSFLGLGVDWQAEWADKIDVELIDDTRNRYQDLRLREEDGNLTWTRKGVQWDGGENNGTWTDSGTVGEGWNKVDSDEEADNTPGGQDVYFIGESGATGTEEVVISGTVAPTNVYVESGNYKFAGDGHIQMAADGVLTVGGDPKGATRLTLSNANTNLPFIELQEDGFLVLNNDGALTSPSQDKPDTAKTKIRFMGGTLEFGEDMKDTDVSDYVATTEDGSTEAARVNVGDRDVTWGDAKTQVGGDNGNGGLTLILNQTGLEKSGAGEFTLAWEEALGSEPHGGKMEVKEGTLTLDVSTPEGDDATPAAVLSGNITGAGTLKVSNGKVTLRGNNTVAKIELTGGSDTTLGSENALGDEKTELTLSGGDITGNGSTVKAHVVHVVEGGEENASTVNGTVTFNGAVDGNGTLAAGTGAAVTLSGSLAGFTGTLDTGADGTITLSGPDTEVGATVVGSGTLDVNSAEGVTLVGTQLGNGENLTVKNSGKGDLVIASRPCDGLGLSFGASAGRIVLGDAGHAITVSTFHGVTGIGTGDVVLSNVTLSPGKFSKGNARLFVETAVPGQGTAGVRAIDEGAAATVYVDGMDASELDGITVNEDGLLAGVSGTYNVGSSKQLTLHFTAANMGTETDKSKITRGLIEGGKDFRIEFSGGDAEAQGFHLEFDETALVAALRGRSNEEIPLYLLALRGGEWDAATKGVQVDWSKSGLLDIVVTEYGFKEDGLWIKGSTKDLYIVMDDEKSDPAVSTSPEVLERRLATVVTEGQTLTLNWAGGNGTVHNLLGGPNATLNINDTSNAGLTVTLDNAKQPPSGEISDSRYPDPTPAVGPDTTFDGTILGGKGVNIRKTGTGTLTVGGDYTLEDGYTRLEAGALRLRGASNHMGSLTFAYSGSGTEERGLLLEGGDTSIGSIAEDPKAGSSVGNKVSLTNGAGLTLTGKSSTLASTAITGDEKSTLKLGDGAGLSLTGEARIDGIVVEVGDGAALDFGATTASKLAELNGGGTLKSAADGKVTVSGGSFSGTLGSSAEGGKAGVLAVTDGASFTLDNAKSVASAPDKGMDVQLGKGSGLTVNVGEKNGTLVLGDISIGDGHLTLDFGEESVGRDFVRGNITSVGPDGSIKFESAGKVTNGTVGTGLTVDSTTWEELLDSVEYGGLGFFRKDVTADKGEDGKELVLKIEDAQRNKLTEALKEDAQGSEKNALAGAVMVWGAFLARPEGETRPGSDFDAMTDNLADRVTSGNTAGLAGTLAAAAGASISTLGPALAEDLHRQLTSIRNRTTTMANEVRDGAGTRFPLRHAWIDAETGYHELDSDGLAPGYKLTGWGGTVGADFDMSRHLTAGLAFTAMYGDLDADATDSATGDLDTYYLSAFARVSSGSWIHSFVLSGGVADVELNRTVNYGGFSPYRTNGSTDGYALGVLYEVGYTGFVNRQGTAALQPIFNVEVRHIALKGYTETGSDAGVDVDDIDQTVLTFGAGARAQFAVGAHAFNRAAVLETRALLKADMGDRSGSVSNAIIGSATRAEVESAEVGAVGVEAGVGITVPLGVNAGSVFLDGSFEFREGWTSANATLGYRINF